MAGFFPSNVLVFCSMLGSFFHLRTWPRIYCRYTVGEPRQQLFLEGRVCVYRMTCVCLRWFVLTDSTMVPFWGIWFFQPLDQQIQDDGNEAMTVVMFGYFCGAWTSCSVDFKSRNPWRNHEVNVAVNIVGCDEQKWICGHFKHMLLLRQKSVWREKNNCWRKTLYFWLIRNLSTVVWGVRSHQPPKFSRKHLQIIPTPLNAIPARK